jgi:hypothetical protein
MKKRAKASRKKLKKEKSKLIIKEETFFLPMQQQPGEKPRSHSGRQGSCVWT